jgi:hypothetical protein
MQEAKKNPSDPDAVVTADAGAVWVDGDREPPVLRDFHGYEPCVTSLDHQQNWTLFAAATRTEYRDESPYTVRCSTERDFIRLDRLHTCQRPDLLALKETPTS